MASAAKRPAGLAVKRDVAQRKERASYAAKREKIVKAAGSVLKQYGLGGTTIEAIAKEAGLGRATIYYYFADKGAIFGEVIHGGLAEMVAALEEVAASGDSPEVQLRRFDTGRDAGVRAALPSAVRLLHGGFVVRH